MMRKRRIGRRPILNLKTQEIIPSERQECLLFWEYCQTKLKLGLSVFHVPNEGKRDEWYAKALKAIGLTPGVLDYIFLKPNHKWHALIIDMKRRDERSKPKKATQEAFIENAMKEGYYATYAYGFDDALKIYTDYVNNRI